MRLLIISCIPDFGTFASQTLANNVECAFMNAHRYCKRSSHLQQSESATEEEVHVKIMFGPSVSRDKILPELKKLADYAAEGAGRRAIVFYTGHGDQMIDRSGDEADGRDEFWRVPTGSPVLDDDISHIFASIPTHPESLIILISDSCSSGTMIDKALMPASSNWVTISACRDIESALATSDGGAFTLFGLIPALNSEKVKTLNDLFVNSQLCIGDQHVTANYSSEKIKEWTIF